MALVLSIETSTTVTSAALHRQGQLLASAIIDIPNSAASQLAVIIDEILKQVGVTAKDLAAVAVSAGPGSYTGLRIGVATAKGICYAMSIPMIAVNSLEVMAVQVNDGNVAGSLLCPMIDARRMEVYTMLFDSSMRVIQPVEAKIIDEMSYSDRLQKQEIIFFGNGAGKCREMITNSNAKFIDGIFPSAEWLGKLAFNRFVEKKFEDVGEFEPFYLKDFIAKKPKTLVR